MSVGVVNKSTGDRIQTAGDPLDKVGNLANLTTSAKANAVEAINEVNAGKANQAQLATVEASTTASKAYSAGEYLVLGGVLYKVTANIAQGGTIVTEGAGKNVDLATVGGEISALKSGLTNLKYHQVAESASTGTYAQKLQSLAAAYSALSAAQKQSSLLIINGVDVYHSINTSGNWFSVWVESTGAYLTRYGIDGSVYVEVGGTVTDNSSVENGNVFSVWVCE